VNFGGAKADRRPSVAILYTAQRYGCSALRDRPSPLGSDRLRRRPWLLRMRCNFSVGGRLIRRQIGMIRLIRSRE
jgi:hypothetical protein